MLESHDGIVFCKGLDVWRGHIFLWFTILGMHIDDFRVSATDARGYLAENNSRVLGISRSVKFSEGEPMKIRSLFLASSSEKGFPRLTRIS